MLFFPVFFLDHFYIRKLALWDFFSKQLYSSMDTQFLINSLHSHKIKLNCIVYTTTLLYSRHSRFVAHIHRLPFTSGSDICELHWKVKCHIGFFNDMTFLYLYLIFLQLSTYTTHCTRYIGKSVSKPDWKDLEDSRRLRVPEFLANRHMKVLCLSALSNNGIYTPEDIPSAHIC
jgi:hypothetical protein